MIAEGGDAVSVAHVTMAVKANVYFYRNYCTWKNGLHIESVAVYSYLVWSQYPCNILSPYGV